MTENVNHRLTKMIGVLFRQEEVDYINSKRRGTKSAFIRKAVREYIEAKSRKIPVIMSEDELDELLCMQK